MKKTYNKLLLLLTIIFSIFTSCNNFDDLNTNPDLTTSVTSGMLATNLILDITREELSGQKSFMYPFMLDKYILWIEYAENMQYNYLGRADFDNYVILTNVQKMIESSTDGELESSYTALGHFIRAWIFYHLTMQMGDIPYSDALSAESDNNLTPVYDTQKNVFLGILNELDKADSLFNIGSDFSGDMIYDGSTEQWQKVVNTFELQVLMSLSKKANDEDLDVVSRFQDIVNNRAIFESNDDNFGLTYSDATDQKHPWASPNNFTIYPVVSSTLIDTLQALKDRRLFYFAAPSSVKLNNGYTESDWDAYAGIDPSLTYSTFLSITTSSDYSTLNSRYSTAEGEPIMLVNYAHLNFILAEAAVRGWISGDAETYYNQGIRAAMEFVADNTENDEDFHHNMPITDSYIEEYLSSPLVELGTTDDKKLEQILTQKFICSYLQVPLNTFYDNRRTGYPVLPLNEESNLNDPNTKMPVRWMYPSDEYSYNAENVNAAVSSQYSGSDDSNGIMWILKE